MHVLLWIVVLITLLAFSHAIPFSMKQFPQLGNIKELLSSKSQKSSQKFGTLKLCPPGGRSFFEAFQLACPMRRKRSPFIKEGKDYRPATVQEIMNICCLKGCEFTDFFPHCGPFEAWT